MVPKKNIKVRTVPYVIECISNSGRVTGMRLGKEDTSLSFHESDILIAFKTEMTKDDEESWIIFNDDIIVYGTNFDFLSDYFRILHKATESYFTSMKKCCEEYNDVVFI